MNIIISNNNDIPIYEQIERQIKDAILSGRLKEGEALPSMRLLAKELRISIITTKRAYEDLERDGLIESFTGKGSFVKQINRDRVKETIACEIEELFTAAIVKAKLAGIGTNQLMEQLRLLCEDMED